jgi:phosphotriesterase-related protein
MTTAEGFIVSVTGTVNASALQQVLPHEHVMVDFIGAKESGPHRYNLQDVANRMEPFVQAAVDAGIQAIFECTPMYLARDPLLLRELSTRTGMIFVTNTGQYKEPYLPEQTFAMSAEELAHQWIREFTDGIDGGDVRPGFIKTAVHPEPLKPVQQKIIRAAAIASRTTGLTIATHTGVAVAAHQILDILEQEEVPPNKWIFVHAQNEPDPEEVLTVARRGAWIELDGLREDTADEHWRRLSLLLDAGFADRVLLSHDSGVYRVGEPDGGKIGGYTYLNEHFVPSLRTHGVDESTIHLVVASNPVNAYRLP